MSPARTATRFVFDRYEALFSENQVIFEYVIEYPDHPAERFREVLTVPGATKAMWEAVPSDLLERVLQSLHLVLGVSYWKMYCPSDLLILPGVWSSEQLAFWHTVYTQGMGEFYYKNEIDFRDLVHFSAQTMGDPNPVTYPRADRCLVPIGGGKDSATTAQLLRQQGISFHGFTMGSSHIQTQGIVALGVPWKQVERQLDPLMLVRSKAKEVYNGHVPVSLVYFFTSLLMAVLEDYRFVVFSNEASSSVGNVSYLGMEINHQWSKSLKCEGLVSRYLASFVTPDIQIFSLLRPLHEIEIMRRFVAYGKYFDLISSCNRNFVVSSAQPKAERGAYWCGSCPKCAFVFALFAAFLPKQQLCDIFGKNLFADEMLLPLYQELLGLKGVKPFECVGLPEEVLLAFTEARAQGEWSDDVVMKWVIEHAWPDSLMIEHLKKELFSVGDLSTLPEKFRRCYE